MTTDTTRRVRLRAAVHVSPIEGGLYCVGWQETLKISGSPALARLWTALYPHLHRGADPDALVAALPEKARDTARRLLDELLDKGFLRVETSDRPTAADLSGHPDHQRTLAFLDSAADDPVAAFTSLRVHPIAIHGHGPVARAVTRCLLSLGAGRLFVTDPTIADDLKESAVDSGADLSTGDAAAEPDAVRVYVDPETPATLSALGVVDVAQLTDRAVVTPIRRGTGGGVANLLSRMRSQGVAATPGPVPAVVATLAGDLAAMQVFYLLTDVATEYDGQAYVVEAERLGTTVHPVWEPGDEDAGPIVPDRPSATDPDRIVDVCDPVTGVLPAVEPGELPQMPLAVVGSDDGPFGWGVTGDVARYRAVLDAGRTLAGDPPPTGLWSPDGRDELPVSTVVSGAGARTEGMLADGAARLIAAWLADPAERAARFVEVDTRALGDEDRDRALLRDLAVVSDAGLTVTRLRPHTDSTLTVVEVSAAGRRTAVYAHPDAETAERVAVRHATAVAQAGGDRRPVPVVDPPPGAPTAAEAEPWDAVTALAGLCRDGERIAAARFTGEPALDLIGAVGWIGVHRAGGAR